MSNIYVNDIYAEDLFEWFYNHVQTSGGDGAIVCSNYKETSDMFINWWQTKMRPTYRDAYIDNLNFWHPHHDNDDSIHYHDNNEDFIFTNNIGITLHRGDYIFIVTTDCEFGFELKDSTKIIKAVKI